MSDFLFAYGTLQPGLAPEEIASVVDRFTLVGEGSVPGLVYDLGSYPGAIAHAASETRIFGRVFRLPDDPGALEQLDCYEGFSYLRVLQPVLLTSGDTLLCWMYTYTGEVKDSQLIATGRFEGKSRPDSNAH